MTQVKCYAHFCLKTISLVNVGKQALTCHLNSVKHKNLAMPLVLNVSDHFPKIRPMLLPDFKHPQAFS